MKKIMVSMGLVALLAAGCAPPQNKTQQGALIGTGVGAAAGAGLGQAIGGNTPIVHEDGCRRGSTHDTSSSATPESPRYARASARSGVRPPGPV